MEENLIVITRNNLSSWRAEYHRLTKRSNVVEWFYNNALKIGCCAGALASIIFFLATSYSYHWSTIRSVMVAVYFGLAMLFGVAFCIDRVSGRLRGTGMGPYLRTFQLLLRDCRMCGEQVDLTKGNHCQHCHARVDVHLPYSC